VATIAETTVDQVYPIVEVFRHPDRSFLMPPAGVPLREDTVLDISHESLIRQWNRLTDWVADEAASARTYRRLRQTARLWKSGEAALWQTPDLEIAEVWRNKQNPNDAWASRYGGELDVSAEFLDASVTARSRRQRVRRWSVVGAFAAALIVAAFMAVAALSALQAKVVAYEQKDEADKQRITAVEQRNIAEKQKSVADIQTKRANRSSYNAGFTGILDQWRADKQEFARRLDSFSEANREFTWYFCRSLAQQKEFDPRIVQTKRGAVNALAYVGGPEQLLSGGENGEVRLWNLADTDSPATPIWTHPQGKPILAVSASPVTRLVAFAADDGSVGIVDASSHRLLRLLDHGGVRVRSLEFSPDGSLLATATDDNNISIWQIPSGVRQQTLAGHTNWVASVAFSPDGKTIASAAYDTTIRLWKLGGATSPIILRGHEAPVLSIAFAPDGKRLASGSEDQTIKLWDIDALKCRETVAGHAAAVNTVAFSPDGELIVSGDDDGELRMWKVDDRLPAPANLYILREWVPPQRRHGSAINRIAFSPAGEILATGSSDSTIMLWDANFGLRLDSARGECKVSEANGITFTTDAAAVALVSEAGAAELWRTGSTGEFTKVANNEERPAETANATSVCFRPHSVTMAIGNKNGSVGLWNAAGMISSNPEESHETSVLALAFDPSGELLASADELGWIYLWKVEDAKLQRIIAWKRHTGGVRSFAFAPKIASQKMLASASEDGTVRIWNLDGMLSIDKEKLPQVVGNYEIVLDDHEDWVGTVAFSPERPILASAGDDGSIRLWEWESWSITPQPQRKRVLTGHLGAVTALAFSHDGKTLASGGVDKMVRLWDPLEGHMRLSLPGHLDAVRSVAFVSTSETSHPRALASFSEDGILKFWMAETSESQSLPSENQSITRSRR
jgi:WD40 repeat protein